MESDSQHEPKVDVYEAPNGVLKVIVRTIDDEELRVSGESRCGLRSGLINKEMRSTRPRRPES